MNWSEMTDEEQAAHYRIAAALEAEGAVIGPCSQLAVRECEDDPDKADELPSNAVLAEWVAVQAWTDLETGETWLTKLHAPKMPRHHVDGLLGSFV